MMVRWQQQRALNSGSDVSSPSNFWQTATVGGCSKQQHQATEALMQRKTWHIKPYRRVSCKLWPVLWPGWATVRVASFSCFHTAKTHLAGASRALACVETAELQAIRQRYAMTVAGEGRPEREARAILLLLLLAHGAGFVVKVQVGSLRRC